MTYNVFGGTLNPAQFSCGQLSVGLSVHRQSTTTSATLSVHVKRADGLPSREFSGTCDPYVKVRSHCVI